MTPQSKERDQGFCDISASALEIQRVTMGEGDHKIVHKVVH